MIYLDNSATTMVRAEVLDVIDEVLKKSYGNPSSLYDFGYSLSKKIDSARCVIAKYINACENEIYFNSCATEGNNTAIFGSISSVKGKNVVTTRVEHPSVFNVYKSLKERKDVRFLKLDNFLKINLESLSSLVDENTEIVSISLVHNEFGTIQDVSKIGSIIKEKNKNCIFHVDAAQAFGKVHIDVKKDKIDILTFSGHKIHAPKGIGAMFVSNSINLKPYILGGGQEKNLRSGTENVSFIMGLSKASQIMYENIESRTLYLKNLKNILIKEISKISDVKFLSPKDALSNILAVAFKDIRSEVLLHFLESEKIYISTGSACSKGKKSRSLEEIKLENSYIDGMIRISLSEFNTEEQMYVFVNNLKKYVQEIRTIMKRGR